jgi:cytochrome c
MKSHLLITAAAAALTLAGAASAAPSAADLLKSKGCMNCHSADTKKMGPSWKDIAAKHKGSADAVDKIAAAIKDGKGHPKSTATEAEIKSMVTYVVTGK